MHTKARLCFCAALEAYRAHAGGCNMRPRQHLKKSSASPLRVFTASPALAQADHSGPVTFVSAFGKTVSPPSSTVDLTAPPTAHTDAHWGIMRSMLSCLYAGCVQGAEL